MEITNGPLHLHLESDQSDKSNSRALETDKLSQFFSLFYLILNHYEEQHIYLFDCTEQLD